MFIKSKSNQNTVGHEQQPATKRLNLVQVYLSPCESFCISACFLSDDKSWIRDNRGAHIHTPCISNDSIYDLHGARGRTDKSQ